MRVAWITMLIVMLVGTLTSLGIAQVEKPREQPREDFGIAVIGDGIVVPGERIGPIRIGMSIAQMLRVMPSGFKRDVFEKEKIILYEWRREGVWVSLQQETRIVRLVSVFGTGTYKTDKGVWLLNTRVKMEGTYGKDHKRYDYPEDRLTLIRYVPLGLQFGIVNFPSQPAIHERILTIGIFTPGKEPPLVKTPSK